MSDERSRTVDRGRSGSTGDVSGSEFDIETGVDERDVDAASGGLRSRVGSRASQLFSPRYFVAALLLTAGGLFAANALVPLPLSGLVGVFVATFAFGLVASESRYAEATIAGGAVVGASVLLDYLVVSVLGGFGLPLVAIGALAGGAVAALGTYFGRDLRAGLTRDI